MSSLDERIAHLEEENAKLDETKMHLEEENAKLDEKNMQLGQENWGMKAKIEELRHELRGVKKRHNRLVRNGKIKTAALNKKLKKMETKYEELWTVHMPRGSVMGGSSGSGSTEAEPKAKPKAKAKGLYPHPRGSIASVMP